MKVVIDRVEYVPRGEVPESQLLHLMREIRADIDRCQTAFKRRNLEAEYRRKGRLCALQWVLRRLESIQPEEEQEPQKPEGWFPAMAFL